MTLELITCKKCGKRYLGENPDIACIPCRMTIMKNIRLTAYSGYRNKSTGIEKFRRNKPLLSSLEVNIIKREFEW